MSWGNENCQNESNHLRTESERFENTAGAQDTDPTDPEWEFTWTVFMSYLMWCLNPSPHFSGTVRSTFPRHIFKYHGKQTGGRLFKRGDDLSLCRLAQNNHTSAFRCPVHRHGGDAEEMWEENSQSNLRKCNFNQWKLFNVTRLVPFPPLLISLSPETLFQDD